jgi:flavodoxin I
MKTGIFYSYSSGKTQYIAERIAKEFGEGIEANDIETVDGEKFSSYDLIILGVSTWMAGGLSDYWEEVMPWFKKLNLKGKKLALFGLGDQIGYPRNFGDAVGILADIVEPLGAELIGFTSTEGYQFKESAALRNKQFMGLMIDEDSQPALSAERIKNWVNQIKKESGV